MGATMFARINGEWIGHLLGPDAVLAMPEIGLELPLAELYEGLSFTPLDTGRQDEDGAE